MVKSDVADPKPLHHNTASLFQLLEQCGNNLFSNITILLLLLLAAIVLLLPTRVLALSSVMLLALMMLLLATTMGIATVLRWRLLG